ncbi:acetyltransferase (GNAT) family protein [Anaeroplasma bactoclasticum]|jgi:ribosomal protein S18 acetylase RimI-like enzyme|uniref:Acetyltransferase (GNAT) family protein n=1 Tax=Anaeroplasma bactoclasticum TaxID=2088 RepID=A0A397QUV6_9MOLU|nr:GNAT family N-acetyltransferase [Anaeroplasma bactoclasticum]RIA64842.1 acetyltransferase (GNAT) family protein [Anaeroplasma bactoclasticum]
MIRRAKVKDINRLIELLKEVCLVHHNGRSDIFKIGTKYTKEELEAKIKDDLNPIFVYTSDEDITLGYIFCETIQHTNDNILTDIKTLYIDDLCVDEEYRGKGIGKSLYYYAKDYAKKNGYYNITLNVWELNDSAKRFYSSLGLLPLKTYLEEKI